MPSKWYSARLVIQIEDRRGICEGIIRDLYHYIHDFIMRKVMSIPADPTLLITINIDRNVIEEEEDKDVRPKGE